MGARKYYHFPASHWKSIRSTNVIESTFATIRRRSNQTNGHASRDAALAMMFTLAKHAEKSWRRIDGFNHIANVIDGIVYTVGEPKMAASFSQPQVPSSTTFGSILLMVMFT